ncbi:aspartate:alanine exchanger family transporter [Paracoccus aerodenitrificans]|uniref:aspartate:alanine exchanger family transporter n=1 Tax=Paracoccus aerodenitrificans TaxID=3017781 RepID=UPI0022F0C59A|nr:TrkA C-terminal domain-containing protein [Paracoccus aerodenitrificans]WBU62753.1 transporter [Paracoccus aerodenitrificans]
MQKHLRNAEQSQLTSRNPAQSDPQDPAAPRKAVLRPLIPENDMHVFLRRIHISSTLVLLVALTFLSSALPVLAQDTGGAALEVFPSVIARGVHGFFELLDKQKFVFLLLALSIGYPLGRASFKGISLGPTAGTLLVGVLISLTAKVAYDITYSVPGLVSTIFLLMFMYALGLKVGPQFFAGLRSGGKAFIIIGLIVWLLNWIIVVGGVNLVGMAPGFAPGIISGSYTITAIIGVATSAMQSGAYVPPEGMSVEQVGANIAAGYAVSYILSSLGIILLIRYLPSMFGRDPVADAKEAEIEMSGGASAPVPGASGALTLGYSPSEIRSYRVEHEVLIGKSVQQLFDSYPAAPILRVVRNGKAIPLKTDPVLEQSDIVGVRADVHDLILKSGEVIGPEVDEPLAREVGLEAADIRVGKKGINGKTLKQIAHESGMGLQLRALFRQGNQVPFNEDTVIYFGDVMRVVGPDSRVQAAAEYLGGRAILDTTVTEVSYMTAAMAVGYLIGIISVTIGGIPFALGTSAGCLLAGIFVAYFRSRNPEFGGPVDEGARAFIQDIGLNMFVAVLAANVGPKIIQSFQGFTVVWIALIGTLGALVPPFVGFYVGHKFFNLNSVIAAGAATGARNSTPGLNAICEESQSNVAAVPYPITYAITTVLALVGGYIAMVIS